MGWKREALEKVQALLRELSKVIDEALDDGNEEEAEEPLPTYTFRCERCGKEKVAVCPQACFCEPWQLMMQSQEYLDDRKARQRQWDEAFDPTRWPSKEGGVK